MMVDAPIASDTAAAAAAAASFGVRAVLAALGALAGRFFVVRGLVGCARLRAAVFAFFVAIDRLRKLCVAVHAHHATGIRAGRESCTRLGSESNHAGRRW
jgi:hypothetical protein